MTRDYDILAALCAPTGEPDEACRISVDDLDDPDEADLTGDEIHLTMIGGVGRREEPRFCLRLSVISARLLIDSLEAAIRRRDDHEER